MLFFLCFCWCSAKVPFEYCTNIIGTAMNSVWRSNHHYWILLGKSLACHLNAGRIISAARFFEFVSYRSGNLRVAWLGTLPQRLYWKHGKTKILFELFVHRGAWCLWKDSSLPLSEGIVWKVTKALLFEYLDVRDDVWLLGRWQQWFSIAGLWIFSYRPTCVMFYSRRWKLALERHGRVLQPFPSGCHRAICVRVDSKIQWQHQCRARAGLQEEAVHSVQQTQRGNLSNAAFQSHVGPQRNPQSIQDAALQPLSRNHRVRTASLLRTHMLQFVVEVQAQGMFPAFLP